MSKNGFVNREARSKYLILEAVCSKLAEDRTDDAKSILQTVYPFTPFENAGRRWSKLQAMQIYIRDGFLDRYSGLPLVFPGTLRLLSLRLPDDFPFHQNWKTDRCHLAYWELCPTIDHVVPVSRGGADNETNWVTTSMVKNSAKANFLLEEIGWQLLPRRSEGDWDGLTTWFSKEIARRPESLGNAYIRDWARALEKMTDKTVSGDAVWNRD
jgi:5-methylcytosine-specific restriction endonuclease McrA